MKTDWFTKSFKILVIILTILFFYGCTTENSVVKLSEILNSYIDTLKNNSSEVDGKRIYNPNLIIKLYTKNGNLPSPKWTDPSEVSQMISEIHNAVQDGLLPDDYHLSELEMLTEKNESGKKIADKDLAGLDLLLTDAFVLLASHIAEGKTNPDTIYPQWSISRRSVIKNWDNFLDSALLSDNLAGSIQNLTPRHREYSNLKKALIKYRQFEKNGGWQVFSTNLPKLQLGLVHPDVLKLRERLSTTQGDPDFIPDELNLFDKSLMNQVIAFQKANGLDPDGVVGKTTIEALNIPVADRIKTIEANLERWRWIRDDLGKRYIKVNIADFSLQLLEDDQPVFQALAVVGRPFRQTPVFFSALKYMVVNPYWVIPTKIIKEEIVPLVKKNPDYLAENNMKILRMDGAEVDPSSINWNKIAADRFPYMIRQEPGAHNALGKIAFMFPNEYSVYIHDTPSQYLFSKSSRAFSHGCIRINKALELAEYLIRDSRGGWDTVHLQEAIAMGKKEIISLKNPIPVYILYLTASADDDGSVCFAKDIYERDQGLIDALKQGPYRQRKQLAINNPVDVLLYK